MSKVVFFGECLIELKPADSGLAQKTELLQQSFAGDVVNAAIYLKRLSPNIACSFFSTLGTDDFSQNMQRFLAQHGLDTELLTYQNDKLPGLYSISTDETGERSFFYWRSDSAARYAMEQLSPSLIEQIKSADMFVFSGISLAILPEKSLKQFWRFLAILKAAGCQIVFDPNYRASLWQSKEQTKSAYEQAMTLSDTVLPGVEDFASLYQANTFEDVIAICQPFDVQELVIKDGPNGVLILQGDEQTFYPIEPIENVVDTTSAGDSFNGVYLGCRLQGNSPLQSAEKAAAVAGIVIQHRGAIIQREALSQFI